MTYLEAYTTNVKLKMWGERVLRRFGCWKPRCGVECVVSKIRGRFWQKYASLSS